MKNSVFRPSIDLHELLLITRHCIEQRENLAKQRARLAAQQQIQRELRRTLSRGKITAQHGVFTLKMSAVIWFARTARWTSKKT